MILYPAIDIRGGRAVRLVQGDYDRETAFDADPLDAASRWLEQGARALHVVDLDGARAGAPVNIEHVERICEAASVPVQVGGGLREAGDVAAVIAAGASRAILGTAALSDPARVRIVNLVATSDEPVCACHLIEPLGLSQPTVSHHLKRLVDSGLLEREQRGKWAYFSLAPEAATRLASLADLTNLEEVASR